MKRNSSGKKSKGTSVHDYHVLEYIYVLCLLQQCIVDDARSIRRQHVISCAFQLPQQNASDETRRSNKPRPRWLALSLFHQVRPVFGQHTMRRKKPLTQNRQTQLASSVGDQRARSDSCLAETINFTHQFSGNPLSPCYRVGPCCLWPYRHLRLPFYSVRHPWRDRCCCPQPELTPCSLRLPFFCCCFCCSRSF